MGPNEFFYLLDKFLARPRPRVRSPKPAGGRNCQHCGFERDRTSGNMGTLEIRPICYTCMGHCGNAIYLKAPAPANEFYAAILIKTHSDNTLELPVVRSEDILLFLRI